MNATLDTNAIEPASIAQLAKLNQLVADQEPTVERMQQVMRLVPDLLKSDLGKVNRYDFCRLIGRELPFAVLSGEISIDVNYDLPFQLKLAEYYDRGIIRSMAYLLRLTEKLSDEAARIKIKKATGIIRQTFFVVECCDKEKLKSFDLQAACLEEFLAFEPELVKLIVKSLSGRHGNYWLRYSIEETPERKLDFLNCANPYKDDQDFRDNYSSSRLDGAPLTMPTLVRRID